MEIRTTLYVLIFAKCEIWRQPIRLSLFDSVFLKNSFQKSQLVGWNINKNIIDMDTNTGDCELFN